MSLPENEPRFRVAFSFPGEKRACVEEAARLLAERFGEEAILYDRFHTADFARPNLGSYLPELYHKHAALIVVVVCAEYVEKEWCGLELRAVIDLIKKRRDEDIMPSRGSPRKRRSCSLSSRCGCRSFASRRRRTERTEGTRGAKSSSPARSLRNGPARASAGRRTPPPAPTP